MTKYAFLDTETSGLPEYKLPADHPSQPRLASMALIKTDEALEITDTYSVLIKPDGWKLSPEVMAINGLTTERCEAEGVPLLDALCVYTGAVHEGYVIVAFNAQFDTKVMRGELRRSGYPDLFEETPNICAMRASKSLGVEKSGPKKGGFPRLTDVYRHFFGRELESRHTAIADALACLEVFRELKKLGVLPEPAVHYAKEKPEHVKAAEAAAPAQDMEVSL